MPKTTASLTSESATSSSSHQADPPPDRKGKGKARELSHSPGFIHDALSPLEIPEHHEVEAREAYLSPPLTAIASEKLFSAMEDISRVLMRGLSLDFNVDLDLQSGSEEEEEPSIADDDVASPAWSINGDELRAEDYVDTDAVGENVAAASDVSFWEGATSSSISSSSTPSSSRVATVGNTTQQDPGSTEMAVRFPSIFTHDVDDISTLESPIVVQSPSVVIERDQQDEEEVDVLGARHSKSQPQTRRQEDGYVVHAQTETRTRVAYVKRKKWVLRRRKKILEEGLTRDFFLIITLCFGMACAGILILRPTVMAMMGFDLEDWTSVD